MRVVSVAAQYLVGNEAHQSKGRGVQGQVPTAPATPQPPLTEALFLFGGNVFDFLKKRASDVLDIKESFACNHPETLLTRYTCSNGAIQYVMQCLVCKARTSSPIAHSRLTSDQKRHAPDFDDAGRQERRREINHRFEIHRELFNSVAWWRAYNTYLISNEWIDKRAQVLARDRWKCQEKRNGCTVSATEVHHLTYKNVGDEPLEDLLSVCHHCHELITAESRRTWRVL